MSDLKIKNGKITFTDNHNKEYVIADSQYVRDDLKIKNIENINKYIIDIFQLIQYNGENVIVNGLITSLLFNQYNVYSSGEDLLLTHTGNSLTKSVVSIAKLFSFDKRIYCMNNNSDYILNDSMLIGLDNILNVPSNHFSTIIFDDTAFSNEISKDVLIKILISMSIDGTFYCLTRRKSIRMLVEEILGNVDIYDIDDDTVLIKKYFDREKYDEFFKNIYSKFSLSYHKIEAEKKKTVLFMPSKLSHWENMQQYWKECCDNKDKYTGILMPIPYIEKNNNSQEKEWYIDDDILKLGIPYLNYNIFSLKDICADIVITDVPYGEADINYDVLPDYFAENIKMVSNKLICMSEKDNPRGGDSLDIHPGWTQYILLEADTWQAEKFYYQFQNRNRIVYFASENGGGEFHGNKIVKYDTILNSKSYLLLVSTDWNNYIRIRNSLEKSGKKEFKDFWYAEAYLKKIAIINANCYGRAYAEYLNKSQYFTEEYFLYPNPSIHVNTNKKIREELLNNCDLFIHQDIRKDNKFGIYFSDEYIIPKLKKECKRLIVPNLVPIARCIFPIDFVSGSPKINCKNKSQDVLFAGNKIIDRLYNEEKKLDEIIDGFLDINIISDDKKKEIKKFFDNRMELLIKREEKWDVKISDYIVKNYKYKKMFTDLSHPTQDLMHEICYRIGEKLGLPNARNVKLDEDYEMVELFVMPCVKDALRLEFDDLIVRSNNKKNLYGRNKLIDGAMDLKEYIREYIYWKFGKFLD